MITALRMFAGIAVFTWYLTSLFVGWRLLRLGVRGDNAPARWIGTYLFAGMGLGSVFISIAMGRGEIAGAAITPIDRGLMALGMTTVVLGNVSILTFTRHVFRRESAIAKMAAASVIAVLVVGAIGHGITTGFHWKLIGAFAVIYLCGTILSSAWTAAESLLYYRLMRKRLKIGLAEPLEANRFLLWGAGAACSTTILIASTSDIQLQAASAPGEIATVRWFVLLLIAVLGLTCASCYLFAFFPARWYVRRFAAAPGVR